MLLASETIARLRYRLRRIEKPNRQISNCFRQQSQLATDAAAPYP
jgi:hypothetical protein